MRNAMNIFDFKDCFGSLDDVGVDLVYEAGARDFYDLTIVIPTYHRPSLLKRAIESAVGQRTTRSYLILVVDNSEDENIRRENETVVRGFHGASIKLYRNQKNVGMFGNWNRGIRLAEGEWLSILSDDDELAPQWIDEVLGARQGAALVGVATQIRGTFPTDGPVIGLWKRTKQHFSPGPSRILRRCDFYEGQPFWGTLGVLWNRRALTELGGYDERLWPSADYAVSLKYFLRHGAIKLSQVSAYYHWGENESANESTRAGFRSIGAIVRSSWLERAGVRPAGMRSMFVAVQRARETWWAAMRFSNTQAPFGRRVKVWLMAYGCRLIAVPVNRVACMLLSRNGAYDG
jgi:glycosyltransferase involved in cell wall biosynthesis